MIYVNGAGHLQLDGLFFFSPNIHFRTSSHFLYEFSQSAKGEMGNLACTMWV